MVIQYINVDRGQGIFTYQESVMPIALKSIHTIIILHGGLNEFIKRVYPVIIQLV